MFVCRLCLLQTSEGIHIFREIGVSLNVSSILSKHFGSLFEVTADNDEAICTSCWVNTENFHVFYESIKNAQNCYSSDEEEHGHNGLLMEQQQQQHMVQQVSVLSSEQMDPNTGDIVITQNYTIHDEYESVGKHLDDMMMLVEQQEPMTYVEEIIQSPDQMCSSQMISPIVTIRERTISISSGEGQSSSANNSQSADAPSGGGGGAPQATHLTVVKKRAPVRKRTVQPATVVTAPAKPYTAADDPQEPYRMQCDLCSKTFKTFHRIQTHYQKKHNMDGYVSCCGDQFFEKDLLVDHILMHVNNRRQMKKITCQHCEQFFYRRRFYVRHLLKVHNIAFNCQYCSKKFLKSEDYTKHLAQCAGASANDTTGFAGTPTTMAVQSTVNDDAILGF